MTTPPPPPPPPPADSAAAAAATAAPSATDSPSASTNIEEAPAELTAVVDDLLDSLSNKFASVSSEIYEKIEAMSKRLDQMEASLQQSSSSK